MSTIRDQIRERVSGRENRISFAIVGESPALRSFINNYLDEISTKQISDWKDLGTQGQWIPRVCSGGDASCRASTFDSFMLTCRICGSLFCHRHANGMIISIHKDPTLFITTGLFICRDCAVNKSVSLPDSTSILNDAVHLDVLVYDKDPHLAVAKGFFKATREEMGHQFPFDKYIDLDSTTRDGASYDRVAYAHEILDTIYPLPPSTSQYKNTAKQMIASLESLDPIKIAHIMRLNRRIRSSPTELQEIPPPKMDWITMRYSFNAVYRTLFDFMPSLMAQTDVHSLHEPKPTPSSILEGKMPRIIPFLQKYVKLLSIHYALFNEFYPVDKGAFPGFPMNFYNFIAGNPEPIEKLREVDFIKSLVPFSWNMDWVKDGVPKGYPETGTLARLMPLITEPQPGLVKPFIEEFLFYINFHLQQELLANVNLTYTILQQQYNKKGEDVFQIKFSLQSSRSSNLPPLYTWKETMQWITKPDGSLAKDIFPLLWFLLSFVSDVEYVETTGIFFLTCAASPRLVYPQRIKDNIGTWGKMLWDDRQPEELWNILVHFNEHECSDYEDARRFTPPGPKEDDLKYGAYPSNNDQASYLINSQYLPNKASENLGWKPPFTEFTKHVSGKNKDILMTAITDIMLPRLIRFLKIFTPMPSMLESVLQFNIIKRLLEAELNADENTEVILWHYLYHQMNISQILRFAATTALATKKWEDYHPFKSSGKSGIWLWYYWQSKTQKPIKHLSTDGVADDLIAKMDQHEGEMQMPLYILASFAFSQLYQHTQETRNRQSKFQYVNVAPFLDFEKNIYHKNQFNFYQVLSTLGAIDHMRFLENQLKQESKG